MWYDIQTASIDFDEQYEHTVLTAFEIEDDEVTELIEIDPSEAGGSRVPRLSFMSSLFRAL